MWWWVGLWVILVLGAGVVLGLIGRTLWRKGMALVAEMDTASERLTEVLNALNAVSDPLEPTERPAKSYDRRN